MAKITIDVNDKNLPTVLNILENLKSELITNLSVDTKNKVKKDIKPVSSSMGNQSNKRYLSKDAYKQKLNQKPEEDEFLPKTTSTGKYLSANDFKNRLKKRK
ncbi:hypothetical protein [Arcobacter sp. LA11]|uniref:hypothetical protein n=1 Tax=Arcobacter sp. LA11 TaxID=1898176 RepID=UPI000933B4CC|nr:hypothetical protein [Arcobacter sp. LA11]